MGPAARVWERVSFWMLLRSFPCGMIVGFHRPTISGTRLFVLNTVLAQRGRPAGLTIRQPLKTKDRSRRRGDARRQQTEVSALRSSALAGFQPRPHHQHAAYSTRAGGPQRALLGCRVAHALRDRDVKMTRLYACFGPPICRPRGVEPSHCPCSLRRRRRHRRWHRRGLMLPVGVGEGGKDGRRAITQARCCGPRPSRYLVGHHMWQPITTLERLARCPPESGTA